MPENSIDLDRAANTPAEADFPTDAQLAWLELHARLSDYTRCTTGAPLAQRGEMEGGS